MMLWLAIDGVMMTLLGKGGMRSLRHDQNIEDALRD